MSDQVLASGLEGNFVAFKAPSGQWGVNLDASLVSMNASFGFNQTAHRFNLQFVTEEFNGGSGNLPAIDTYTRFEVRPTACEQGFFIAGKIVHADYNNSVGGTSISIEIEDRRKDILNKVKVTNEDLGDTVPSGLVSVGSWYRNTVGFKDTGGSISDSRVKEYRNILELGATYDQIYNAILWAQSQNNTDIDPSGIPSPTVISANMLEQDEPLRWKLTSSPLATVISTVCSDASYDWYWGMRDDTVRLVNRKVEFIVNEDSLPIQVLSPDSVDFKFGADRVQAPGQITLLGAHQEGVLNSRLLSSIDGVTDPSGVDYTFTPAWGEINLSFYDAFGVYRTYKPSDTELAMALQGIDFWAHYKLFQTTEYGDPSDAGSVAAQHPTFQSRLDPAMPVSDYTNNSESGVRIISSRYGPDHIWCLEWFSRVANHANNHFGKTYKLEGFAFDEENGFFQPVEAAWCNLENQKSGPLFEENYNINPVYSPVSPFITQDFKVRAHVVLPSGTLYGVDGVNAPAGFADWNEDAHPSGDMTYEHYIPASIKRVGQKVINPRDEEGNAFEDYPEGTLICQLPILAASGRNTNAILANLVTLFELGVLSASSGLDDIFDPTKLIEPYQSLSGVSIPVQARPRYGQDYPNAWTSGNASGVRHDMIIDDRFAPWNFFPKNTKTSTDVMSQRASGFMEAKLISVNESRFAELNKVDWPFVGFDEYADQSFVSGVYGRRDHGVSDISVSYTNGVPRTTYGVKSFFTDFVKEAPLGEKNFADLNSIIHPVDFQELNNAPTRPDPDIRPRGDGAGRPIGLPGPNLRKETYAVTITQVLNRGSTTEPERYYSITKDNVPKPGGVVDPLDDNDLICRDGFFNVGDPALYIVEYKSNGQRRRYYTNGTDLTAGGAVATVTSVGASTVDISYRGFSLTSVPTLGKGVSDIVVNEQGIIVTDGTMKPDNDGGLNGLRPDRDVPTGVYFQPSSGTGGGGGAATPVQIIGITDFETSGAQANVQTVIPSGANDIVGSGTITTGVYIMPHAIFAQSGDLGILAENADGTKFVFLAREAFTQFTV